MAVDALSRSSVQFLSKQLKGFDTGMTRMKTGMIRMMAVTAVGVLTIWFAAPATSQDNGSRIAWYATLESGLEEAKRSGRPILFTSAAPQCLGVSGIW